MSFLAIESSALTANAASTSLVRQTDNRDSIVGTVYANVAGDLKVEQGYADSAGINQWDSVTDVTVAANTPASFTVPIVAPQWRIIYTNGGADATTVRIYARTAASSDDA